MTARASYVTTTRGQIRVWRAGDGPAVIVLPGLADAARVVADRLAREVPGTAWTVLEPPGIGGSAGVSFENLTDIATIVSQALAGLTLAEAPLLADDLSGAIALHLPKPGPLVLAGTGRAAQWCAHGFAPPDLTPRPDGTHLVALHAHLRSAGILDPADPVRPARTGPPLPSPEELHEALIAAGVRPDAYVRLWRLCAGAQASGADTRIEDMAEAARAAAGLARANDPAPAIAPAAPLTGEGAIWCDHVDIPEARVHLRRAGTAGRPLIVLQSAPGSTAPLWQVISTLGRGRRVIAPDFPGNGRSEKPDGPVDIARIAGWMWQVVDTLGFSDCDLWGTHTGALVALEMALAAPERVGRMVMEAPPLLSGGFTADILANYLPPIRPDPWGLHVLQAWTMRRDMFLFWPWYRRAREAGRDLGLPPTGMLHDWTIGLLESGTTYNRSYRAAFEYRTVERLPHLTRPTLVCAGPTDMLADGLEAARRLAPGAVRVAATPGTVWYPNQPDGAIAETLRIYADFLDSGTDRGAAADGTKPR